MLLMGIDLGTSSIKVSVVDAQSQQCIESAQYPSDEMEIIAPKPGWAEQSPSTWWANVKHAIHKVHASKKYDPSSIGAIGIAYQMHGLVITDNANACLRNAIIWCDSRAVEIGNEAFRAIGEKQCLMHLLNSPGNFTASKLAWVKQNEPAIYEKIYRVMLPGDFIALQLTGDVTTSISALSEGIFWDFMADKLSDDIFNYFGFDRSFIPPVHPVFSSHGTLRAAVAEELSLRPGIPVSYKAGDQPNNALSLNVLGSGEVAATAGTSGVIYAISDALAVDPQSRVNTFAHVNYTGEKKKLGVLLCINGTGILNRWVRDLFATPMSYSQMNDLAQSVPAGSEGLMVVPFGNGAERMLGNKLIGAHIHGIDLNVHRAAHLFRAAQEGIAFAFRYGIDIMRENGINPSIIRAGRANLFLSKLFTSAFVDATGVPVELFETDGSMGAALGAGIGAGVYQEPREAFAGMKVLRTIEPDAVEAMDERYLAWRHVLENQYYSNV